MNRAVASSAAETAPSALGNSASAPSPRYLMTLPCSAVTAVFTQCRMTPMTPSARGPSVADSRVNPAMSANQIVVRRREGEDIYLMVTPRGGPVQRQDPGIGLGTTVPSDGQARRAPPLWDEPGERKVTPCRAPPMTRR